MKRFTFFIFAGWGEISVFEFVLKFFIFAGWGEISVFEFVLKFFIFAFLYLPRK